MQTIGAFEAKNTLGSSMDGVEQGEEIVITRHGKPVACLVGRGKSIDREKARAAADRILARAGRLSESFDWEVLKALRDEGRP